MAKNKRTILMSENPAEVQCPIIKRLLNKVKNLHPKYIHGVKRGFGGEIVSFERTRKPKVKVGWEARHARGAGDIVNSSLVRNKNTNQDIRGKKGPRFRLNIKF